MGWSEALSAIGQGLGQMSNMFGTFQRREDEMANQEANRAFQAALHRDRMEQSNREMEFRQNQADRGYELDQENMRLRQEELTAGREYQAERDAVNDAARTRGQDMQERGLNLEEQRMNDRYLQDISDQYSKQIGDIQKSPMYQQQLRARQQDPNAPAEMVDQVEGLQMAQAAADIKARMERNMLSEEQQGMVQGILDAADERGVSRDMAYAYAHQAIFSGIPKQQRRMESDGGSGGGSGSAGTASKPTRGTQMTDMAEARNVGGKTQFEAASGRTYDEQGNMIQQQSQSGQRDGDMMSTIANAWKTGQINDMDPQEVRAMASEIVSQYSQQELEQQYPGLYRFLVQRVEQSQGSML